MSVIERNQNWVDGEVLYADVLDGQFDKIYDLLNGTDDVNQVVIGAVVPINDTAKAVLGGQLEIQQVANGEVIRIFSASDLVNPRASISNLGWMKLRTGSNGANTSAYYMHASGCPYVKSNNIGNVGAGVDDLHSFIIGANAFSLAGGIPAVKFSFRGYTAANGNNKTLKFFGKTTEIMTSGVITENNKPWFLEGEIVPDADGVSTVTISGRFLCGATEVRFNSQLTGYDFTADNTWKMTGEAVADNDIVNNIMIIEVVRGLN